MAVLGQFGTVRLSREWPAPTALADERLQRGASPSLDLSDLAFQSGDEVLLVALRGVPLGIGTGGAAPCPDGHAFFTGGTAPVGPSLAARTAGGSFWSANAALAFWESAASVGFQQTATAYIHRDELDDVRFYGSELDAINGGNQGLLPLRNVSPGPLLILPASAAGGYVTAALQLLQAIAGAEIPDGEQPAANLAPVPQVLTDTAADVEERGWLKQCDLTEWVFEMDATQLDQDAIGQAFGESAKGVLRGAGSFNGEIDHSLVTGEQSGLGMLRLMMLTEQGSKARARFQLLDQRNTSPPLVNDLVFYETDIMLGKTSVNTASTDVIRMSAQFIATGRIRLVREGSTPAPISPALLTGAATGRASLVGTVRVAGLLSGAATGRGALAGSITATSAPATDPYFANVSLLLPLDAADGSTIFTDFSPSPLTLTTAGNARIRTAWSKWGGSAGNCDGTGDYATISSPSATLREWWNGGAYSIEAWIRMDAVPASLGSPFIGNMDPVSNVQWWAFGPNDVGTGGKLQFRYWNGSSNSVVGTTTMTTGTDYFMQLIVSGTTIELWLDGALEATATVSGTPQSSASQPFTIGQTDNHGYHGYFDDVRITPGLARPTTVPTAPFPTS